MNKQRQSRSLRTGKAERGRTIAGGSSRGSDQFGPYVKLELTLRNEVSAISPFVDSLMDLFERCGWLLGSEHHVEVALREALANAIVHGNHQDPEKNVYVGCIAGIDEVSIVVRDEGQGFDFDGRADPTDPQNLESGHGRGIYLMESMMDEVHFERGGSVVYMRKSAKKDQQLRLRVVGTPEISGYELG